MFLGSPSTTSTAPWANLSTKEKSSRKSPLPAAYARSMRSFENPAGVCTRRNGVLSAGSAPSGVSFRRLSVRGTAGIAQPHRVAPSMTLPMSATDTKGRAPSCTRTMSHSSSRTRTPKPTVAVREEPPRVRVMRRSSSRRADFSASRNSSDEPLSIAMMTFLTSGNERKGLIASTRTQEAPQGSRSLFSLP